MRVRRLVPGILLLAALAAGCGASATPFNPAQSCQAVGGTYTADGLCRAGSL